MSFIKQFVLVLWASPTTIIATAIGVLGLPFGTKFRRQGRTLEIYGGVVEWLLSKTPVDALAMTLGHVIWRQNSASLDFCREHELIHVRQYERWGPFFIPLYFYYSFLMWLTGKHPYYDNPFEREAFGECHPHYKHQKPSNE